MTKQDIVLFLLKKHGIKYTLLRGEKIHIEGKYNLLLSVRSGIYQHFSIFEAELEGLKIRIHKNKVIFILKRMRLSFDMLDKESLYHFFVKILFWFPTTPYMRGELHRWRNQVAAYYRKLFPENRCSI